MPKTQFRDNSRSSDEDSNQSCISFNFTNNDDHHDSSSCNEQDDNLSSTISGSKQTTVSPHDQANGIIQHDEEQSNILDGSHDVAPDNNTNVLPDDSLLEMYDEIINSDQNGIDELSTQELLQIDLLKTLMRLKAPIKAYKEVLDWAQRANETGFHFNADHPSREALLSKLQDRLNIQPLKPKEKLLFLPQSKRVVNMVYFDAKAVFASMLTCPILNQDDNYIFDEPGGTPFSPPPEKPKFIGDLNTSRGYIDMYASLVTNPTEDVLLPCVFALDATNCDTFGRLKMEPLTISYGLMKQPIRNTPIAMRILGYVNHSPNEDIKISSHEYATLPKHNVPYSTTPHIDIPKQACTISAQNVNDYHAQIYFILQESGFLALQDRGFKWIIRYKGATYQVTFRTYVPFIIGDTEGHDQLCGHYKCRTGNVAQLCRSCKCPTHLSGWSKANFPLRKTSEMKRLMTNHDTAALQQMSQHYLSNGFDRVRFGDPQRGIFGAVPGEILHLVLLGWFNYTIDAFVAQAGSNTLATKEYDQLFSRIGNLLSRQSDRDLPRTVFRKGLSTGGHLMAEEIPGCLLVMLFTMHTKEYMDIFGNKPRFTQELGLGNESHITDWITLLSSLLQWLSWLKQSQISRRLVDQSKKATRWLMRLFKFVAPRTKGMGNNTIKMHLVLHIADDIIRHGVPQNFNSAFMESAHIPLAKDTSRNTQKRVTTFTLQAARRYAEYLTILKASYLSMTSTPSAFNAVLGDGDGSAIGNITESTTASIDHADDDSENSGGRKFIIYRNEAQSVFVCHWKRRKSTDISSNTAIDSHVKSFLIRYCLPSVTSEVLQCFTSYTDKHSKQIYRAHPNYMGGPWYDCAMVRWHDYEECIPARILAFVDLSNMVPGRSINIPEANQDHIGPGLYAVVESFSKSYNVNDSNDQASDEEDEYSNSLIQRYKRDESRDGNGKPILYLVGVGSIAEPVVGIPDNNSQRFTRGMALGPEQYLFLIHRRKEWSTCWESIIRSTSTQAKDELSSSEDEDDL